MNDFVMKAVDAHKMIGQGDNLLVALSGGADSVALLHFLHSLKDEYNLRIEALHLNHNLRGDESRRDEAFVRQFCADLNIPLTTESCDVAKAAKEAGESIELCARRLRYDFFFRHAAAKDAKVATAHNMEDNAETVLLNLIRGTALRGLCGIPPVREVIIRPLIAIPRKEIEDYCAAHRLHYVTDSTNACSDYTRNRIRHGILPLLIDENPRAAERISKMTSDLRADADFLSRLAQEKRESIFGEGGYDRAAFLALDPALSGRVLAQVLETAGIFPGRETLRQLTEIIAGGCGGRQLSKKLVFKCGLYRFYLEETAEPQDYFELTLTADQLESGGKWMVFPGKQVKISKKSNKIVKKGLTYWVDYDRIDGIVVFRGRLKGDKLRLPGRGCTKTLKNLFWESGVSAAERTRRVIVADDRGPIAVEGIGVDERVAADKDSSSVIILEISEDPK